MFVFIGVKDGSMSSVVSLGVPCLVVLSVTAHGILVSVASIPGGFSYVLPGVNSVFPVIFSFGSVIYFLK